MREFDQTQKRKRLEILGGRVGARVAQAATQPRQPPIKTEEEAELLSAALCSVIGRNTEQMIHAHVPIDEARVLALLQD